MCAEYFFLKKEKCLNMCKSLYSCLNLYLCTISMLHFYSHKMRFFVFSPRSSPFLCSCRKNAIYSCCCYLSWVRSLFQWFINSHKIWLKGHVKNEKKRNDEVKVKMSLFHSLQQHKIDFGGLCESEWNLWSKNLTTPLTVLKS